MRLVDAGIPPYMALLLGACGAATAAVPLSYFVLRLKGGEFAIAMWVVAEAVRVVVMFDPLIQGETGTSLIALNSFDPELRRNLTFWLALGAATTILGLSYWLLRGRIGAAARAIRDDEEAATSVGIRVFRIKQAIFILAALCSGRCSCCLWCWSAGSERSRARSSAHSSSSRYRSCSAISASGTSPASAPSPSASR